MCCFWPQHPNPKMMLPCIAAADVRLFCIRSVLPGACTLQELPRLPESLIHLEGAMPGIERGSYSFKMPGMDGWNASPLPMNQYQSAPQQQQQQQSSLQQPHQQPQQQGGFGQDYKAHIPYAQQLFPPPQQKPGPAIGLDHMQACGHPMQLTLSLAVTLAIHVVPAD